MKLQSIILALSAVVTVLAAPTVTLPPGVDGPAIVYPALTSIFATKNLPVITTNIKGANGCFPRSLNATSAVPENEFDDSIRKACTNIRDFVNQKRGIPPKKSLVHTIFDYGLYWRVEFIIHNDQKKKHLYVSLPTCIREMNAIRNRCSYRDPTDHTLKSYPGYSRHFSKAFRSVIRMPNFREEHIEHRV